MPSKPEKPTRKLSIESFCHNCGGGYLDGKVDCENTICRLYPFMPYAKMEPDLSWMDYNPKKKGYVTWEESSRDLTDEERAAIRKRFASGKKKEKPEAPEGFEDLFS